MGRKIRTRTKTNRRNKLKSRKQLKNKRKTLRRIRYKPKQLGGIYLMKNNTDIRNVLIKNGKITWGCGTGSRIRSWFGKKKCPREISKADIVSISKLRTIKYKEMSWREFDVRTNTDGKFKHYTFDNVYSLEDGTQPPTNTEIKAFYKSIKDKFDRESKTYTQQGGIYLMKNKDKREIAFENNNITWECGVTSRVKSWFGKKNCPIVIPIEAITNISPLKTKSPEYPDNYLINYGLEELPTYNWREFDIKVDIDGLENTYTFGNNFVAEAGKIKATNEEMEKFYRDIQTVFDDLEGTAAATRPGLKGFMN